MRLAPRSCKALTAIALFLAIPSGTRAGDSRALIERVRVVPRHHQWSLVPPEQREALEELVRLPAVERDRLIREGNAVERGLGIFAAEQQADIEGLLSLAPLLEDRQPTIPYALPVAVGGYAHADQSVSEFLGSVYQEWFGVDVDGSRKRFDHLMDPATQPSRLVNPWIVRLRRARSDAAASTELKTQVGALPEEVLWAVVTLGYKESLYSEDEARSRLARLSAGLREAIRAGESLLPDEPLFRVNDGLMRKTALEECRRLLQPSETGRPRE